jgi:cytidylate kinase
MASEFAGIVADGRDVTKVVFPFAAVRVLLVTPTPGASLSAHTRTPEEVARDVERDRKDAVVTGFNVPEKGVIFLDSSKLTGEAIIEQVVGLALDARYRSADARGSRCGPHTDEIVRGKPRVQRET